MNIEFCRGSKRGREWRLRNRLCVCVREREREGFDAANNCAFKFVQEHRNDTKKKRHSDKKYPEKAIYRPPHLRDRGQTTTGSSQHNPPPPSGVYKLEIEVAPKTWHKQVVDKVRYSTVA